MLVLSRKVNETIRIADNITVTVVAVEGGAVKLGVQAPSAVAVHRGEVYDRIQEENRQAALSVPGNLRALARHWNRLGKRGNGGDAPSTAGAAR